ncbi:FAD-dependent oxidoreductase [uncultured Sulfitobacter sp.]|uniref:NAD(P)/FAD-dependent oxidoreductase n=1 Tax=uncultured Sulfitobacter sp. TaxID=191468 RepID=UPI0030FA29FE
MINERVVIVGAGQGGFQAAISLRQEGFKGQISLIGSEPGLPYQRPPLSKAFLKNGELDKLTLRPEGFFETQTITLLTGHTVEAIDRSAQVVRLDNGPVSYDKLIIATGTRNLIPPIPGVERTLGLRTLEDARRLRAALNVPQHVVVIGGGFIGLEFAAVASTLGHKITVAEAAPRLMSRVVSPQMSDRFADLHKRLGNRLLLGHAASDVSEADVTLQDGSTIKADLVLLAAGVVPNSELAAEAGLEVQNGIVVDTHLRTSDPNIYALGDCASFPNPRGGDLVRLESVQAASDHARLIAKQIAQSSSEVYQAVPWFWSDQAEYKLQIVGLATQEDDSVAVGDDTVLRFSNNLLTAVETINNTKVHMQARRVLGSSVPISRDKLVEQNYMLIAE